ncbi:MAG: hypothetical protein SGJ10_12810 [Bacteroidota bacterium]|nr:hypothetical protein [Bacteroidota bacterium]
MKSEKSENSTHPSGEKNQAPQNSEQLAAENPFGEDDDSRQAPIERIKEDAKPVAIETPTNDNNYSFDSYKFLYE